MGDCWGLLAKPGITGDLKDCLRPTGVALRCLLGTIVGDVVEEADDTGEFRCSAFDIRQGNPLYRGISKAGEVREAGDTGEIRCLGFCIRLFASSRIESMVTSFCLAFVSRANGEEHSAGR